MKFYIIGIPTDAGLVRPELASFVGQDTPTLYLHQLNRSIHDEKNSFNGFNFFQEQEFDARLLSNLTESMIVSKTICSVPKDVLRHNDHEELTAQDQAERLLNFIIDLSARFPNTRLAFVTLGNCFTFYEYLSKLVHLDTSVEFEIINTENYTDTEQNYFSKVSAVLGYQMYRPHYQEQYPPQDRSAIFFPHANQLPFDYSTNKTFAQIVDETALTFRNSNNLVAWSGGIDSTMVMASFVKNNIPFSFTVSPSTVSENQELFDLLKSNHNYIELNYELDMSNIDVTYKVITGDCADQLYPGIWHNFVPGGVQFKEVVRKDNFHEQYADYFSDELDIQSFKHNARDNFVAEYCGVFHCDATQAVDVYDNYLVPKFAYFPFEVEHYYQLRWFFRFVFRYNDNATSRFRRVTRCKNEVVAFYNTTDFQKWAIANLDDNFDLYSQNFQTYKQFQKEYNHSVFNLESLLTQTKFPSMPTKVLL